MAEKKIELYSAEYYYWCGIGGILSCGLTHTAVTPLDVVKCNVQANPKVFTGTTQGFGLIYSGKAVEYGYKSGIAGLLKGWAPTLAGYSVQGLGKFGFYEFFKHEYSELVTKSFGKEHTVTYRDVIYAFASASAEFIADIGLSPFEAVKVRVQTNPKYASGLLDGFPKMLREEGIGSFYATIGPLWARQIPYTIIKFVAFERIAETIYGMLPKPKKDMSYGEQLVVIFTSGYLAGILCGAVSHPADTMVSRSTNLRLREQYSKKWELYIMELRILLALASLVYGVVFGLVLL